MTTIAGTTTGSGPIPDAPSEGPSRWARLASLGLAMAAAGPALMLLAALVWGLGGEDLTFFGVTAALAAVGAVLVRSPRTWAKVVAVVLAVLAGMALFWTVFGITAPASFFDFVPAVLVLPGALLALVAGIAAVRAGRRGAPAPAAGEQRAVRGVLLAVGGLAAVSAVVSIAGRETVSETDKQSVDVVVDMADFEFGEAAYDVSGGDVVLVKNSDPFLHTFTVDALGIDVTLNGGSERLVTIPAEPGTYVLYCEPHTGDKEEPADDDMATVLEVR